MQRWRARRSPAPGPIANTSVGAKKTAENEDSSAEDGDQPGSVLLVQTAEGGGFTGQDLTLILRPVSAVTTAFTDRPERDSAKGPPPYCR